MNLNSFRSTDHAHPTAIRVNSRPFTVLAEAAFHRRGLECPSSQSALSFELHESNQLCPIGRIIGKKLWLSCFEEKNAATDALTDRITGVV